MVILKQATVYKSVGKGKFVEAWLIVTHEADGPSLFVYKDKNAKKLLEERIHVAPIADKIRFGTTAFAFGEVPEIKNDARINNANFIAVSTEKVVKKARKPHMIWLCALSTTELFNILKLVSASMTAIGVSPPHGHSDDDSKALHCYAPKEFQPQTAWAAFWDNPPRPPPPGFLPPPPPLPPPTTNLVQTQALGLTKSADHVDEKEQPRKKGRRVPEDKKKKMYSSTPTLLEEAKPKRPSSSESENESESGSESSSSEEEVVVVRRKKDKHSKSKESLPKPKPRSSTYSYYDPKDDASTWDVMYPARDLPMRPLVAPKPRQYESSRQRSQSVMPVQYRPKPSAPVVLETTDSDTSYSEPYKTPQPILKKQSVPSAHSSPRFPRKVSEQPYARQASPIYASMSPQPERERHRSASVHSMRSVHSFHYVQDMPSLRPPSPPRYDYPPMERDIPVTAVPMKQKPQPSKRSHVGYANAEVQTDHQIQSFPLIQNPPRVETPVSVKSFNHNVDKLKALAVCEGAPEAKLQGRMSTTSSSSSSSSSSSGSSIDSGTGKTKKNRRKKASVGSYTLLPESAVGQPELVAEDSDSRIYTIDTHL